MGGIANNESIDFYLSYLKNIDCGFLGRMVVAKGIATLNDGGFISNVANGLLGLLNLIQFLFKFIRSMIL